MSNITTARPNRASGSPLDVNVLNESLYMRESAASFIKEQEGTITQSYANDVNRMYENAILKDKPGRTLLKVLSMLWAAHRSFVDLVEPERFESVLSTTIEGEFCLTRNATVGGRVKLVIDEDLITFSYLPEKRDSAKEILSFYKPDSLEAKDYTNLLHRFFEL